MGCMHLDRAAPPALVVGIAVLTLGLGGQDPARTCPDYARCAANALPAPITVMTGRVTYHVARDGRVSPTSPSPRPYPRNANWFPGTGTWYRIAHDHLVVGRARKPLWRSHEQIAANQLGVVAAGRHGVAFQHDHRLYIAALRGAERAVASRELPLGWTSGGLYTYSYPRRQLLLRSDTGAILKTIASRPLEYQLDLHDGRLYFLTHGLLMRARGPHVSQLVSLSRLGMSTNTWLQPLGGLVELLDDRRLALVRPDGSLFASTPVRKLDRISSFLTTAPDGNAVAFTALPGPSRDSHTENVYLLRAGTHSAIAVHDQPGSFGGCAHWASVEWHGMWLLYSNNAGNLAAIDTAGAHRAIGLNSLARRLHRAREGFAAHWGP